MVGLCRIFDRSIQWRINVGSWKSPFPISLLKKGLTFCYCLIAFGLPLVIWRDNPQLIWDISVLIFLAPSPFVSPCARSTTCETSHFLTTMQSIIRFVSCLSIGSWIFFHASRTMISLKLKYCKVHRRRNQPKADFFSGAMRGRKLNSP